MFEGLFNSFIKSRAGQSILSMGDTGSHSTARTLTGKVSLIIDSIGKLLSGYEPFRFMGVVRDDSFTDTSDGMKRSYDFIQDRSNENSSAIVSFDFVIKDGNMKNAYFICKAGSKVLRQVPISVEGSLAPGFVKSLVSDIRRFYHG